VVLNRLLHVLQVALAFSGCAVGVLGAAFPVSTTAAAESTIRSATIRVGDETLTIDVIVSSRYARKLDGPIRAVVTLPKSTTGATIASDQGFNGRGWSILFRDGTERDSGVLAVTISSRYSRIETAVGLASNSGWAVEAPGTVNQETLIQFYKGTLPIA
jgi:hypothetical protein